MSLQVVTLTGTELAAGLAAVAELRLAVFRDYPYLYDGTLDYERAYLSKFAAAKGAMIVAAYNGERIVGVSTCCPLAAEHEAFKAPFEQRNFDVSRVFYFAESVVLPAYRGQGLGHQFFDRREEHARKLGARFATFCAVVREKGHVAEPKDYRPLDLFWLGRGYSPVPDMTVVYPWREVGSDCETEQTMQFWMKNL